MIVIIGSKFEVDDELTLIHLILSILHSHHALKIESTHVKTWIQTQSKKLKQAIKTSERRLTTHINTTKHKLTIEDKIRTSDLNKIRMPLYIMLENGVNDKNFLYSILRASKPSYANMIEKYENEMTIQFIHAGGIDSMELQMKPFIEKNARIMVIADNDSGQECPKKCHLEGMCADPTNCTHGTTQCNTLRRHCNSKQRSKELNGFWFLTRRSIESYTTLEMFEVFCSHKAPQSYACSTEAINLKNIYIENKYLHITKVKDYAKSIAAHVYEKNLNINMNLFAYHDEVTKKEAEQIFNLITSFI